MFKLHANKSWILKGERARCPLFLTAWFAPLLIQDLPVNVKFVIEGMEEAGSLALEELVQKEKAGFFSSVDYIVISDNLWVSRRTPALTWGTRGNSYFMVEVLANGSRLEVDLCWGPGGEGRE